MQVIDADTHVDETETTWEYIDSDALGHKPVYVTAANFDPSRAPGSGHYWLIDGRRQRRRVRSDDVTRTTKATRELLDVDARLRHMDQLGVRVHVIYPTMFATEFTDNPETELALRTSYNRWLGERTGESREARERLRWVMLPSLWSIDKAVAQIRWAKDSGACGVLKKGDREAGHWPAEEYFYPVYEEAERLDLPICFHLGGGVPDFTPASRFSHVNFMQTRAPIQNAFHTVIKHNLPTLFPKLRFAMVEGGASWIPYLVYTLKRDKEKQSFGEGGIGGPDYSVGDNVLKDNRIFVTCQVDEDLPYIMRYAGEDNLMVGSDYSHSDPSQEGHFPDLMREWARRGLLTDRSVDNILWNNSMACYAI